MANPGTLHRYTPRLVAFEHSPVNPGPNDSPNTLLWIGGLTDGLLTVRYPTAIATNLPADWVLAEVMLSSSYKGWATGSLKRDARELGLCVQYFKNLRPGKKVVLMGHSTGCQDIMEYVVGPDAEKRVKVDGAILQGGVSDREAWEDMVASEGTQQQFNAIIEQAKKMIDEGKERELLPREGNFVAEGLGGPISAYRTYSLLVKGADDDYFSSDLEDEVFEKTFGKFPESTPLCFLLGEQDPYVPASVSKEGLLKRWTDIVRKGGGIVDDTNGGVVPGAHHNLNDDPENVVKDLVNRVVGFLNGLDSESSGASRL